MAGKNNNKFQRAFSLIELSVVILIIGTIIAGVTQGSRLVSEFRLNSARALARSSDVNGISDVVLWVDAASEKTLTNTSGSTDVSDGDFIQSWTESNPTQTNPLTFVNVNSGTQPTYLESAMNGLPTLSFDGVDDYLAIASDPRINDMDDFSIFAVISVSNSGAGDSNKGIITKMSGTSYISGTSIANPSYSLVFNSTNLRITSAFVADNGSSIPTANVPYYDVSGLLKPKVLLVTLMNSSTNSTSSTAYLIRVNGNLGGSRTTKTSVSHVASELRIGQQKSGVSTRFCNCYISEIIMFNRYLLNKERDAVEKYLSQKWNIKISS